MGKQDSFYLEHILTPSTEQSLFGKQLLDPLLRGENITVLSLPHGGIREKMKYFINKIDYYGSSLGKTIFVYLDPNDLGEDSPEGYFDTMATFIDNKEIICQKSLGALKEKITKCLEDNCHLIFILGYFHKLNYPTAFFNSLVGLHQMNRQKVSFIFASAENIFNEEGFSRFGELRELLVQNIVYFPVLPYDDAFFVLKNLSLRYGYRVSENKEKLIINLAGGHPTLILLCLRIFAGCGEISAKDTLSYVSQKPEIKIILESIWESFNADEKNLLLQIAHRRGIVDGHSLRHLQNLGVVNNGLIFSSLLDAFIREGDSKPVAMHVLEEDRQILIGGQSPKVRISGRDYKLLAAFSKKPGRIISRDEVAEILWDKLSYDKYSDWAIDRAIYSLRRKLQKFGVSSDILQTVKGLGYRWVA